MNTATLELARSAVASPHWRWLPGMRIAYANSDEKFRVCGEPAYVGGLYHAHGICEDWEAAPDGEIPDLTDPVTVEAVGILAREAWGADAIDVRCEIAPRMGGAGVWWTARTLRGQRIGSGSVRRVDVDVDPRAACYVAALLAAPAKEVER